MQADDPPFLPVGTDVSAKYKGAFCEAKIKKVVRNIKCKVTFKGAGGGSVTVLDDAIKGTLRVGNTVEVRLEQKKDPLEAIITKIQDCSQYTVVFDDGDITTLRRSALCLKSGRHFAESETLDQLPLTHPEHFGNPVIGSTSRRGRRNNRAQSDDSDSEASEWAGGSGGPSTGTGSAVTEREPHAGRVVLVQCSTGDKKRAHHSHQWFPGLVVAPNAQDTVKIKVKDDYLVRSFKDGRYYTVPKKEAREFKRSNAMPEWNGVDAALLYLDKGVLPTHWDRDILFGQESQSQSDEMDSEDSMDDEPHEEKDHFVAQLYKFMDDRGTPLNRQPTIANKDVDLYRLFNVVQKLGGYNKVTNQEKWKKISVRLGFVPATPSVINLCRSAYKKFLHSFEDFYRKLGVTLLSHPRGGRTTGRSLIRDKDKMHSTNTQKSASPAPAATVSNESEKLDTSKTTTVKGKEKDAEKETKAKEKVKEVEVKEKEVKPTVKDKEVKDKESKEKDVKEKEVKEKEVKEPKIVEKEKEIKGKEKVKEVKEKEITKEKVKEKETVKVKQKETKVKTESVNSSEEDSGDNQPLAPLTIKSEKEESPVEKSTEKIKAQETPKSKLFKSASGTIDLKKSEKNSAKKIAHRRNSLPRCTPSNKSDGQTPVKVEGRCKSSSSDSSTNTKKQPDADKVKDKDASITLPVSKKQTPSSDKNDSDSSSRGSKNGKTPRRTPASSSDITPPQTPASSNSQPPSNKKQRKRKITDLPNASPAISANVGDKLKVYYGPTHSESKVTYEAKVIEINVNGPETLLRVHYTGWNTRYDEWIKPSRIADNLTQHSKGKHKDKGKKNSSTLSEGSVSKKPRSQSATHSTKPHTRNRSGSNNTIASNQISTDASVQSESDSDSESDSSGQIKKAIEESKIATIDKMCDSLPVSDRESSKEKTRNQKITKTPNKRSAEGSQGRVKRARTKAEDSPRGRDFDLNEIRSELKGLDNSMKQTSKDSVKSEAPNPSVKEEIKLSFKQEKTPEKVTEDIYEFKEPEPFEFEARKSEEKKKRPNRIFDDIPPLKLSPNASPDKPVVVEPEKVVPKSQYDAFDKLCQSENYQIEETSNNSGEKEGESLSLFSDIGGEDSADKIVMSEGDDSQEPLTFQHPELFTDKYMPIFKHFTPAKNQETYSKKNAPNKLKTDIEDDFTNSPIKGEQSSDEDPIDAAIQRVNAHPMSDDSNDGDLLIKTPATPTVPSGGLLSTFVTDSTVDPSKSEKSNMDRNEVTAESKLEVLLKLKTDISNISGSKMETPKKETKIEDQIIIKTPSLFEMDETIDSKKEIDTSPSFSDVIMPEPPVGFLLHKEGPSIAEKVLLKINSAKKASNIAIFKETGKSPKPEPPKTLSIVIPKNILQIKPPEVLESTGEIPKQEKVISPKILEIPMLKEPLKIEPPKKEVSILASEIKSKIETPVKTDIPSTSKKETIERRKSIAEPTLSGKNNKVLNETIQKLSSQISQPTPALSIPEYQTDDRSESTDSDDSDSRLIIDKLSEEESQSCLSLPENITMQPTKIQTEKPTGQWNLSTQIANVFDQTPEKPETSTATKDNVAKQIEEDSNISLLLCEETIPGSPAPENLSESIKINKPRPARNLEPPYPHVSSMGPDAAPKEHITPKEVVRDRDNVRENRENRENREPPVMMRNERLIGASNSADMVLDNTPPITPDSSDGNDSPSRDQQLSDVENHCDMKLSEDENRIPASSKISDIDKNSLGNAMRTSAPNSPGAGTRRGRRPRGCRLSDSEDQTNVSSYSHSNSHRQIKYNFYSEIDPLMDGASRIELITSRLSELRKVYHDLKAELATIDRRRKKLRRKEREAVKAAKAACS